jgi:tyrosinase
MTYVRKNVYELGGDWADPILWYARGVAALSTRALADVTSWRFYGGIHGFYKPYWESYGYLTSSDKMPSQADIDLYWNQCQHSTWYFLPWHRGYLITFEQTVRAAIEALGGPKDWALPYWNYFPDKQNFLPPAFDSPVWPGTGTNPLYVAARFGPKTGGHWYIPKSVINLNAMNEPKFTGTGSGAASGFGGLDTGFNHGGGPFGQLESQPHNIIHSTLGGTNPNPPNLPGLMATPPLAALDPIFWLHHANIDRLWESWVKAVVIPPHTDPVEKNWLDGPPPPNRRFAVPKPDGKAWHFSPGDVNDISKLDYTYDTLVPGAAIPSFAERLTRLGMSPSVVQSKQGVAAMTVGKNVELVGANRGSLQLVGAEAQTSVELDPGVRQKVAASLTAAAKAVSPEAARPDRVFLNLENVRGTADGTVFQVYVNLPQGADPAQHPELLAGSAALFGVREASLPDEKHAGQGLTFVLDISSIVDNLHLNNALNANKLDIRILPLNPVSAEANITVGRVSVFREGQ